MLQNLRYRFIPRRKILGNRPTKEKRSQDANLQKKKVQVPSNVKKPNGYLQKGNNLRNKKKLKIPKFLRVGRVE